MSRRENTWDWDAGGEPWFGVSSASENTESASETQYENTPRAVFWEVGLCLAIPMIAALAINAAFALLHFG